jgi:hypothetical protein
MIVALIALAAMVLLLHYPIYVLFKKYNALEERHEALKDYVFGEARHGSMHYREITERLKKLESEGKENG